MASPTNPIIIHENLLVSPQSSTPLSLPLTFFDLFWLRFHPVERIFFYSLPTQHSHDPSFFFDKIVPNLKTSLSLTLQKFLPLSGNIIWPSDSPKPMIQYNPGDAVSLVIAESNVDFNHVLQNSPCDAVESRFLLPNLDSSDSTASVISLQVTLFPNRGFTIGITSHHAVLDGKSSIMFIKAWATMCRSIGVEENPSFSLEPEFEPFFDRDVIKDPTQLDLLLADNWSKVPSDDTKKKRSLEILSYVFKPNVENSVRATFDLSRGDLDKLKKRVLSKWDEIDDDDEVNNSYSKPNTLSSFVVICAYVSTCIARAIQEAEKNEEKNFGFGFAVDCRARLEPPIPENYFGNCVNLHVVDTQPGDFTKEDGFVIVAKKILGKIKNLDKYGVLDGLERLFSNHETRTRLGIQLIGVAGSSRFGVYETDFGWGRPAKVEITSVDRSLTIGIAEGKDEKGGLEVALVLKKNVMDFFSNLFHAGL